MLNNESKRPSLKKLDETEENIMGGKSKEII